MSDSTIFGDLEGIGRDSGSLQEISDEQASIMNALGASMETLSTAMKGGAGKAMQMVGEQLQHQGQQFSTTFADHSQKMSNNGHILSTADDDGASMISGISNLIV
ncbi:MULTISPECIES: hypothetical protein [Mycolicibacterium]|uniref:Uncharacterized protein n=1 Tax=Mycolicibacterium llatzerense TaxID=280871 RepID=A0A0D1L8R0_9MYCO|nr:MULTISPECIES: hypothetical protein [Mycolicibacterium]KIU14632.1 hypothetical protein TL10_23510 [Mycolicibacterium llatzerense]MCT7372046.1 hypothetical protein [Mycolicibacterium llatzerense]WGI35772.1 hypothetical protein QDT91_27940 [Mycolicibacterium aubagnense]